MFYRNLSAVLALVLVLSLVICTFLLAKGANESTPYETEIPAESSSVQSTTETPEESTKSSTAVETPDPAGSAAADYEARIEELEALVDKYAEAANISFDSQVTCLSTLLDLLAEENRPMRCHVDEDGEPTGEFTPADVAFCYTDLTTGTTFSYNADKVMYSASLIKAPYVYAMLKAIEDFEYNKLNFAADGSPLYDENGSPLFEGEHPNLDADGNIIYLEGEEKYDLSRSWVYDSHTMFVEGSGEIQNEEDGFTLTYLELVCYALKYSDNIAFSELRKDFGYDEHYAMLASLGISGASEGFMQLSAEDCAKYLTEIYKFCEGDSKYAAAMKEAMMSAPYTVMIPDAVSPIPCAHKYGWDIASYHDMAIVYDEHPFSLVIMTDLDRGRAEDYGYIQSIAKAILEMHQSLGVIEA